MALMALMGWRGLDSMMRSQQYTQAHTDATTVLQTALAQWSADLDGLMALENTQAIAWDGQALRMTRRNATAPESGALVVAWARRTSQGRDQWLRWQSPPVRTRSEWSQAWNQAGQWARNPSAQQSARETALFPLSGWSIYFYREGAWTNPQSSAASSGAASEVANGAVAAETTNSAATTEPANSAAASEAAPGTTGTSTGTNAGANNTGRLPEIPNGIRIELDLAPGAGLSGRLVRDWVNPLRQNIRS